MPASRLTRRGFVKAAGAAALAAATPRRARAARRTLSIMQWSHFVPGYDGWFDETFCKAWGERNDTEVRVEHISIGEIAARAAGEVSAQKGHDLFMFLSPPAAYEKHAIDHSEIYAEVSRKHGKPVEVALRSTFNPRTKRHFAFSDSYVPDPGHFRKDLWAQVGFPGGPDSYDDLLKGATAIKEKLGVPCGLGMSPELDSNMALRSVLWSFGGAEQDAEGRVAINSKATVEALKFVRALHRQAQTPDVFAWDPASNNRGILGGTLSYVANAISVSRTAEKENPEMAAKIQLVRTPQGPARRLAAEHVMDCYVIWKFASNVEGAKRFLVDYVASFAEAFRASEFYNFPCFPGTVPGLASLLASDPKASPPDKYRILANAIEWTTNIGHPGYASAAIDEVFNSFVLPTMFARVARDEVAPEDAVRAAEREMKRIFQKWA